MNYDVKGVGVQHSAVLGHGFVAQTYSHIDPPPKEWMVRPSPTLMATVLVFLKVFSRRRATMEKVVHRCQAPLEKPDARFTRGSRKPSPPLRSRPPTPQQGI